MEEYYKQMVGFEIVGFKMDEGWPVYTVKKGNETCQMVVSQDPEGNGPGFVFIENEDGQQMA